MYKLITYSDTSHALCKRNYFLGIFPYWCNIRDLRCNWHDAVRVCGRFDNVRFEDKRR